LLTWDYFFLCCLGRVNIGTTSPLNTGAHTLPNRLSDSPSCSASASAQCHIECSTTDELSRRLACSCRCLLGTLTPDTDGCLTDGTSTELIDRFLNVCGSLTG
jgi:hypothetical protein